MRIEYTCYLHKSGDLKVGKNLGFSFVFVMIVIADVKVIPNGSSNQQNKQNLTKWDHLDNEGHHRRMRYGHIMPYPLSMH